MQRIELLSGVAAAVVGLLGLAAALIGVGQRMTPGAAPLLVALVMALVGVALGAYLHSARGLRDGRRLLWLAVVLLGIGIGLAAASFGLVLFPALLLGLIAAATATATTSR